jgi:hypothetical protein
MPGLVDIILPTGEAAAVPEENLSLALSSGAKVDVAKPAALPDGGGLLGEAATAALGAGRTASMGFSDTALAEMANIIGGEQARKDTLSSMDIARRANPYSNMAGEFAGMFVGGPTAIGEGIEGAVAEKVGEGLLGKVASFGARGVGEGALIAYQDGITEATLGDHEVNGQKLAAHIGEGALLGGSAGAVLGLGAHGLTTAVESIRGARGPMGAALADEIAGAPGAGKQMLEEARAAEGYVEKLRAHGMTAEQAAKSVDEMMTAARGRASVSADGMLTGALDSIGETIASKRAGGNAEIEQTLKETYAYYSGQRQKMVDAIDGHAMQLAKSTDRMYAVEKAIDSGAYTYKADYMSKLVDHGRFDTQRDVLARLLQETDDVLKFWESTAAKGGDRAGAIASLRKQHTDALYALMNVEGRGASVEASRDFFMKADGFKQSIDSFSKFGGSRFGAPEAVDHATMGLRPLGNKWRSALEDVEVWGEAGLAQKEQNAAFSVDKGRGDHFDSLFADRIDTVAGFSEKTANPAKFKTFLKTLGSEADSAVPTRTIEDSIGRLRDRARIGEKWGTLAPEQAAELRAAADEFESVVKKAREEGESISRIERMQLEEKDKALGGILGLGADIITRPAKTMERLAALRNATAKVEQAIEGGLKRFFGGKSGPELVAEFKPRPVPEVAKDIAEVKTLAANPAALDMRARQSVGDMAKVAPNTAEAAIATFKRAVYFLANEAPPASVRLGVLAMNAPEPRYTAQQAHEWEAKKRAAFDPKTVVFDMKSGKLNREAIRTIEFVSPKLYMEIQHSAQEYVLKLAQEGKIDAMPRAQQAALAALLKVPADGTWQPDFMLMMQAAKSTPAPQSPPGGGVPPVAQPAVMSKRAIKMDHGIYETEAYAIEKR